VSTRPLRATVAVFFAAEVLDELAFGAREAAWPLIRSDLGLSYGEVGLLLSVSVYIGTLLEPLVGVLGDTHWRRRVVVGGGIAVTLALALIAASESFWTLLVALTALFVGAGAFVSLGQATLMDLEPDARERNMARWSVAGGVGAVGGPLLIAALAGVAGGWRWAFAALAAAAAVEVVLVATLWPATAHPPVARPSLRRALAGARKPGVVRWLLVLELADLMTDVFLAYLALYFVDEVGTSAGTGSIAVAVWTGAALVGGLGMIGLLRRTTGLPYLRASALLALLVYPAFLVVSGTSAKLVLVAALGLVTAGWYSIPKARLYGALPGQSGAAMTLGSLAGVIRAAAPLVVGLVAQRSGLGTAMWLLLAGPVGLLVLLPRRG
jgi:FSR family fosmidomycin resistance protein-like MFS transporter